MRPIFQQRTRPCPGHRDPLQPPLPRGVPGQLPGGQRHRLPGHPPVQVPRRGLRLRRRRARADRLVHRRELPAHRPRDGPGRLALLHRLAEPGHRPHAAQPPRPQPRPDHGRVYRVTHEGRPLAEARQDRGRARREAARHPEGAGRPRALSGQDRTGRPPHRRGPRRARQVGRLPRQGRPRVRAPSARGPLGPPVPRRRERGAAEGACSARPTTGPAPRPRASSATGATGSPTRWACSRPWPPTRTRASGSKPSAPPASSRSRRPWRSP